MLSAQLGTLRVALWAPHLVQRACSLSMLHEALAPLRMISGAACGMGRLRGYSQFRNLVAECVIESAIPMSGIGTERRIRNVRTSVAIGG